MESPTPGSRYVPRSSKKRVFPGGSSSAGFEEVEILGTAPSTKTMSSKKKEVVCDIIDVDIEEDCGDVMLIDNKADIKGKGKEILSKIFSTDISNLSNIGSASDISMSKFVDVNDSNSNNLFFGEDEWIDAYYDDIIFDDSTVLESKFDRMDIPPGVEVPFPWLPGLPEDSTNGTSTSSNLQVVSNKANLVPGSSLSNSSLNLKAFEKKDQVTSWKSENFSQFDRQLVKERLGSMFLDTGHHWRRKLTKKKHFGSHGSNPWQHLPLNMAKPSGFMNGSGFGPRAHDFIDNNQNGEPPGAVESDLDEILRNFDLFKNFDTVEDCSDHYYKGSSKQVKPPKNWAKRIQEEWKILEQDLPDTIFVRVYESRMDLVRAVIVGAEGTPYHDGLFFFDALFPGSYPNDPPKVYYHSGGLRINPNLYHCGKVCLSLLNTWSGNHKEQWIPGTSTMLQVLVSIQGLILNAKPFFNEPGYELLCGTEGGEMSSLQYNENTYMHNLQTMVYTMKRPPKHFEALVMGYFCKHTRDILVSCKAYLEGAQVGCLVRGGIQDVDEGDKSCSKHFRHRLRGFITTLLNTFLRIGAKDCQEFLSLAPKADGPVTAAPSPSVKFVLERVNEKW